MSAWFIGGNVHIPENTELRCRKEQRHGGLNYAYFTLPPAFILVLNQCIKYQAKKWIIQWVTLKAICWGVSDSCLSNKVCQMESSRPPHRFLCEGALELWNSDWFWTKNFSDFSEISVSAFNLLFFCSVQHCVPLYQNKQMGHFVKSRKILKYIY